MDLIPIYRIIHKSNLDFIIKSGKLVCSSHLEVDPNYKAIGNNTIIARRSVKPLPFDNSKRLIDYIAFYFGPRSIMLYNIHTGYGEVGKIDQREIIYLVSDVKTIKNSGLDYCFTDGHGLQTPITQFFTDLRDIGNVKFKDVNARDFSAAAEINNPGLKRRKQAEFHVYSELDWNLISEIAVYDEEIKSVVEKILKENNSQKTVNVNKAYYF